MRGRLKAWPTTVSEAGQAPTRARKIVMLKSTLEKESRARSSSRMVVVGSAPSCDDDDDNDGDDGEEEDDGRCPK